MIVDFSVNMDDQAEADEQWAETIQDFSSQYGSESSISYTVSNLAGPSVTYPSYGDYTQCCVLRTYGPWWKRAPSNSSFKPYHRRPVSFTSDDFIELQYAKKVYPSEVRVYETYNPGAVVRILCCDTSGDQKICNNSGWKSRWFELWHGNSEKAPSKARIFSPPLRKCPFPTNIIRLEFDQTKCEYYTELDGVKLCGTEHIITTQQNTCQSEEPDIGTSVDPEVQNNFICDIGKDGKDFSNELNPIKSGTNVTKITQELASLYLQDGLHQDGLTAALEFSDNGYFDLLPEEVIQIIIGHLDLISLCTLAQTSHLLLKHCYDSQQFCDLDLQPCWHLVSDDVLAGFVSRCNHLHRLNLSWTGGLGDVTSQMVINFLTVCGKELTSLRLSCCVFVDDDVIKEIAKQCPNIADLDLSSCQKVENSGFTAIARLDHLRLLNLYRTMIDAYSLIAIIRSCQQLEHLNLGSCIRLNEFEKIASELSQNCKNLRSLDLWRARRFSSEDLSTIVHSCTQLEELDLGWCFDLISFSGCFVELSQKCKNLKKLFLTANRTVCDSDLRALAANCPDLRQLDILGTREVSIEATQSLLESCKKFEFLDVSFCQGLDFVAVRDLRGMFPHVNIKKSFQT